MNNDLIIGIHSIVEAIKNSARQKIELLGTAESLKELKKYCDIAHIRISTLLPHQLQERAKKLYSQNDCNYQRIPSNLLLIAEPLAPLELSWVYENLAKPIKILCLDQVTDVHNGAAIMRTAGFYGVDCVITSMKGNFGTGPSFFRIASGAMEHIKLIHCSSLSKALSNLQGRGVDCIGLTEHATSSDISFDDFQNKSTCLVLGAEDTGLSHAVERILSKKVALKSFGAIRSLNVSVAAAIAMEKFWGA